VCKKRHGDSVQGNDNGGNDYGGKAYQILLGAHVSTCCECDFSHDQLFFPLFVRIKSQICGGNGWGYGGVEGEVLLIACLQCWPGFGFGNVEVEMNSDSSIELIQCK
jgi:hypothetical protein